MSLAVSICVGLAVFAWAIPFVMGVVLLLRGTFEEQHEWWCSVENRFSIALAAFGLCGLIIRMAEVIQAGQG